MRITLVLRSLVYLAVGLFITFNYEKTLDLGLKAITAFGIGFAMVAVVAALIENRKINDPANLILSTLSLAMALAAANLPAEIQHQAFRYLVALWGLGVLLAEGYVAMRQKTNRQARGEHQISAVLGLLVAAVFLLIPLSDRNAVGFFDAYLLFNAVHLGIAGFTESPKSN